MVGASIAAEVARARLPLLTMVEADEIARLTVWFDQERAAYARRLQKLATGDEIPTCPSGEWRMQATAARIHGVLGRSIQITAILGTLVAGYGHRLV